MAEIVRVIRRGRNHTRVLMSDGHKTLFSNYSSKLQDFLGNRGNQNPSVGLLAGTFGIEFEMLVPTNKVAEMHRKLSEAVPYQNLESLHFTSGYSSWQMTSDSSLRATPGFTTRELKSPILKFNEASYDTVKKVLQILNDLGCRVNSSCGTHVHLGNFNRSVTNAENENFFRLYGSYESILFDRVTSASRRSNRFCRSCLNSSDFYNRYHKYNPTSLNAHSTIEFRQHQGTLNATKILNWAHLCRAWLNTCSKSSVVPQTFDECLDKLNLSSELKSFFISRAEDFSEEQ